MVLILPDLSVRIFSTRSTSTSMSSPKHPILIWFFTLLIFVIGIAQGFGRASVYKIINDYYPNAMGTVGGFVAALGALGGCTLPIVFGVAVDLVGIYSVCFMVLYAVLALCMIVMFFANKADRFQQRLQQAQNTNFLEQD